MINSLINFGAVPFGYTSDLFDSDYDLSLGEQCMNMSFQNFRNYGGFPPLPDVILSNTPPPSPLRRAHSYHFLFPEKAEENQGRLTTSALQRSFSLLPTPPPTPTSPQGEEHEGSLCNTPAGDREVNSVRTGLGHIQEVKRRLRDPTTNFEHHGPLPQLTWEVPSIRRSRGSRRSHATLPQGKGEKNGKGERKEKPKEDEHRLRQIGTDLRRIADQFQVNNAKVSIKKEKTDDAATAWAVPAAFTRCITVSLLCLVWWRLLNKLQ